MSVYSKKILNELRHAHEDHREMPFTVKHGPVTVVVEDKVDLILNIEAFRRMTEVDEAQAKGLGLIGAMTR